MLVKDFPVVHLWTQDATNRKSLDLAREGERISALVAHLDGAFPDLKRIGLILKDTETLLLSWLAVLASGREPLILQLPTSKQVFSYWASSVANSIAIADLQALIVSPDVDAASFGIPWENTTRDLIRGLPASFAALRSIDDGAMLQLSSGTTGHRKPVRFTLAQVEAHVRAYAGSFLRSDDVIVSWLPLYHDMGFVACWLMPLMTGTDLVLLDAMAWTAEPTMLFDAVKAFDGSICYMPNFAFELLSKHPGHGPFPSMRAWISCSEPVYEPTIRRFQAATGASDHVFSACYAMAENVFAVSQSQGLDIVVKNGERYVSCGIPIPHCDVKEIDGQFWIYSPSSIRTYQGGERIADEAGFYPSGDTGFLAGNKVVITGRVVDLINIAGRKYLLNDLEEVLRTIVPEARGRVASCSSRSDELGTEQVVFFAEDKSFFRRSDKEEIRQALIERTGIANIAFHFVPPTFIMKTSSGKVNRKATIERWAARSSTMSHRKDLATEIRDAFGVRSGQRPIQDEFDSLARVYLWLLARMHGIDLDYGWTLDHLLSRVATNSEAKRPGGERIAIVALCDRHIVAGVNDAMLSRLSEVANCPVTIEHVNAPPSELLLNDLIFTDYFMQGQDPSNYDALFAVFDTIRNSSLIILDDVSEVAFPYEQVYPTLNHRHERSADADMLGFRWQPYTLRHHLLPIEAVWGAELGDRNESIARLADYLSIPIIRVATLPLFKSQTDDWDLVERVNWRHDGALYQPPALEATIADWIRERNVPRRPAPAQVAPQPRDLPHFCGWMIDQAQLSDILRQHRRFCILGTRSSVPWIAKSLEQDGKEFFYLNSVDLTGIDRQSFDCILMTGAWGEIAEGVTFYQPVYQILFAGFYSARDHFIGDRLLKLRGDLESAYAALERGENSPL